MIYKFQPFSSTKEIGKEYNAHCELVPNDDDWILILDYDCMILDPRSYQIIEKAIDRYPHIEVFSAFTNRVGYPWQRFLHMPDESADMKFHLTKAQQLATRFESGECKTLPTAAGFFLLFRKKYWLENRFKDTIWDGGKLFDWHFSLAAAKRDTVAVIKGIYVWHTYRLMSTDWQDTKHLE